MRGTYLGGPTTSVPRIDLHQSFNLYLSSNLSSGSYGKLKKAIVKYQRRKNIEKQPWLPTHPSPRMCHCTPTHIVPGFVVVAVSLSLSLVLCAHLANHQGNYPKK